MSKSLYSGPVQRWAINFSNGLEYVNTIEDLLNGGLRIFDYRVPNFDPVNFQWEQLKADEQTETVKFFLHSLKWIDQLLEDAGTNSLTSDESKRLAYSVAKEWWVQNRYNPAWNEDEYIWGGHGFALRTTTLVALSEYYPEANWLHEALQSHMDRLSVDFDGYWNHGLAQALALMCVASRCDDQRELDKGAERATKCLEVMIDEEGCINEQAPEYARYIERLLRVVIRVFKLNNIIGIDELERKKKLIREFIAQALTPEHRFLELGDSSPRTPSFMKDTPIEYVLSNGARGVPIPRIAVYNGGFVFGRSGFGDKRPIVDESHYSIRFGPQRIIHGHNDHLSMTFWHGGRAVVTDPGHVGYSPGKERNYVRSHAAHNVPFIVGEKHDWSAYTELVSHDLRDHWQTYTLEDKGYHNFSRRRNLFFADCGPFVAFDEVSGSLETEPRYMTQRWNIAPEFELVSSNSEVVEFESKVDGTRFYLVRYLIESPDSLHGQTALDLNKGNSRAMLGFVAQHEHLAPTWNVGFGVTGTSAKILTAGFIAPPGTETGWSLRSLSDESAVLRIHIGSHSWAVNVHLTESSLTGRTVPSPPAAYGGYGLAHED